MSSRAVMLFLPALLAGCASRVASPPQAAPPAPAPAVASAVASALPLGPGNPPPAGCLSLTFFALGDDSHVVRNAAGRLDRVVTPSGRREVVLVRLTLDQVDDFVARIDAAYRTGELYALSHIPAQQGDLMMPGPAAWDYLRSFLGPGDVVWTFGDVETGLVAVRENRVIAMMVVTNGTTRIARPGPQGS